MGTTRKIFSLVLVYRLYKEFIRLSLQYFLVYNTFILVLVLIMVEILQVETRLLTKVNKSKQIQSNLEVNYPERKES